MQFNKGTYSTEIRPKLMDNAEHSSTPPYTPNNCIVLRRYYITGQYARAVAMCSLVKTDIQRHSIICHLIIKYHIYIFLN